MPPSVARGTTTLADLKAAEGYEQQVIFERYQGVANADDTASAFAYKTSIAMDFTHGSAPSPDTVLSVGNLNTVLGQAFADQQSRLDAALAAQESRLNAALAAQESRLNAAFAAQESHLVSKLDTGVISLQTFIDNNRARSWNLASAVLNVENPLMLIKKERPGHPVIINPPTFGPVQIGQNPPETFPKCMSAARKIQSHDVFDQIFWFYNDPMLARRVGDTLADRARSLENFLTR